MPGIAQQGNKAAADHAARSGEKDFHARCLRP
jgi:hypothetical protein